MFLDPVVYTMEDVSVLSLELGPVVQTMEVISVRAVYLWIRHSRSDARSDAGDTTCVDEWTEIADGQGT